MTAGLGGTAGCALPSDRNPLWRQVL